MNGPTFTVKASCQACVHCASERYQIQGDSGHDVYCQHPSTAKLRGATGKTPAAYIGDTTWQTPDWCPFLQSEKSQSASLDPVCAFHGKRLSEHECLYCCICFETLTRDQCHRGEDGQPWDICEPCWLAERTEAMRQECER